MPSFTRPISELPEHVFLPVTRQLSKRILDYLAYGDMVENNIYINSDWSTHSETSDENHNAKLTYNSLKVDLNIQMNPSSQKWDSYTFKHTTAPNGYSDRFLNTNTPIYIDDVNKVYIHETYSPVTLVLNCELTLMSADLAYQTPQQIFNGHGNGEIVHFNDLFFSYPIPKHILYILHGLWEMDRDNGKPANVPFMDYIQLRTDGTWQSEANRETNQRQIIKPTYRLQALASLEYSDDKPNVQLEDKLPVGFSIPFTYTCEFAMPTLNIIKYPVVYNNQLVDAKYIPYDKVQRNNRISESRLGCAEEVYTNNSAPTYFQSVHIPESDDWFVPNDATFYRTSMKPAFIQAVLIDDESAETITENLANLGNSEYPIKPITKELIYRQGDGSFDDDCIYAVRVFRDDKELGRLDLTLDNDLNLTWPVIQYRQRYRIVIACAHDLTKINPKYYALLKEYFPYLPEPIRSQIAKEIIDGTWHDSDLPYQIGVGSDGWIYDLSMPPYTHSNSGADSSSDHNSDHNSSDQASDTDDTVYPGKNSSKAAMTGVPIRTVNELTKPIVNTTELGGNEIANSVARICKFTIDTRTE